jgi:hypothetical protein
LLHLDVVVIHDITFMNIPAHSSIILHLSDFLASHEASPHSLDLDDECKLFH